LNGESFKAIRQEMKLFDHGQALGFGHGDDESTVLLVI
jgi:hypothetical protein